MTTHPDPNAMPEDITLDICRSFDGRTCVYLNSKRIAGGKPAIGKNLIDSWKVKSSDLAPTSQWLDISEWHEDYGDCLFIFISEGCYQQCEWTSPLTITADGETFYDQWGYCDQIAFKRVDTSGKIPQPTTKDLAAAEKEKT